MASPRLDDANIEFEFSPEEARAARLLDPLKIIWLQTKYAQYWKRKASELMPESGELDRSYIMKIAEVEGRLGLIQELLDDHKAALLEVSQVSQVLAEGAVAVDSQVSAIAHETASKRVHSG